MPAQAVIAEHNMDSVITLNNNAHITSQSMSSFKGHLTCHT